MKHAVVDVILSKDEWNTGSLDDLVVRILEPAFARLRNISENSDYDVHLRITSQPVDDMWLSGVGLKNNGN